MSVTTPNATPSYRRQLILNEVDLRRLWAKIALPDSNGCMLWTAFLSNYGYGQFNMKIDGKWKPRKAHQVVFHNFVGPVPITHGIDHICGVRACVAPTHLRIATQAQNLENLSGDAQRPSASGLRNVYWNPSNSKWEARVTHQGRRHFLGLFTDPLEAARVAAANRAELYTHNDRERTAS